MFCVMYKHITSKLDQIFIFEMICESEKSWQPFCWQFWHSHLQFKVLPYGIICSLKVDFNTRVLVFF